MRTIDAIAERIERLCNEQSITINALSYKAGVANSTIKSIFYGKSKNPGIITIKKLCDALDISLIQFFDSPEFEGLDQEIQ